MDPHHRGRPAELRATGGETSGVAMYSCPACGKEVDAGAARCPCGADLTLLRDLHALADSWFNRALAAAEGSELGQALELMGACCAVRPHDAEARYVLAQLYGQLGLADEAQAALARRRELDPAQPGLAELERSIARLRGPAAPPRRSRAWRGMGHGRNGRD